MTPREKRENVVKLTLYINEQIIEAAKIEAVRQKIPVSVLFERAICKELGILKEGA